MSLEAVGAYLRALREKQGLSREFVANTIRQLTKAATNDVQVLRIEKGQIETKASVLAAFTRAVGGDEHVVLGLLLNERATVDDGETSATVFFLAKRVAGERPEEVRLAVFGETRIFGRMLETTASDLAQVDPAQLDLPLPVRYNIYEGRRPDTQGCTVIVNEQSLPEAVGWPEAGLEWGYNGRGPATLARAMLRYEYGPAIAERYERRFFTDVTARLPREYYGIEWVLSSAAIRTWLTFVRLVEQARGGLADVPRG